MDVEAAVDTAASHAVDFKRAAVAAVAAVHVDEASQEAVHEASEVTDHRCSAVVNPTAENAATLFRRTCRASSRVME